jgi:hypothetical protein
MYGQAVRRKPLKRVGWAYFFNVPVWARKAGCPVSNEPLGTDYAKAAERAENRSLASLRFLAHGRQIRSSADHRSIWNT